MAKRAAIILSGGRSERFQSAQETWQDKALVELLGKPLIVRAVENVQEVVEEVVICVNNEERKTKYSEVLKKHGIKNVRLLIDEQSKGLGGPIVGTLTGLMAVKADYCFTLPSDMPLFQPKVIDHMFNSIKNARVVVPIWSNGRPETLTMVIKRQEGIEIAKTLCQLRRPRSDGIIRGALNILLLSITCEIRAFDPKLESFININSPSDLSRLQPRQTHGSIGETLRLNLGDLPIPELLQIQKASTLFHECNFLEASKAFSSCAARLEKACSYFWSAISRENEGKSILELSRQQRVQKLATEQSDRGKEALAKACSNYELEAKMYNYAHATFLAERAIADRSWCKSWALGTLYKMERFPPT
ncbi:MAG: molybdenum cofactor guanylyltransferase [Candidatus Bathyarchaeota archaeon]|nr:molybdenum cofactor guanylyltransferase [Candidatus Bathyarchaeota archaeon]